MYPLFPHRVQSRREGCASARDVPPSSPHGTSRGRQSARGERGAACHLRPRSPDSGGARAAPASSGSSPHHLIRVFMTHQGLHDSSGSPASSGSSPHHLIRVFMTHQGHLPHQGLRLQGRRGGRRPQAPRARQDEGTATSRVGVAPVKRRERSGCLAPRCCRERFAVLPLGTALSRLCR